MRTVAYLRVSTDEQKERQSVETQRHQLRQYAEREGFEILHEFVDEAVSGSIALDERPSGAALLAALGRGEFDTVLVVDSSRLARSNAENVLARRAIRRTGAKIKSPTQDLENELVSDILASVDAEEHRRTRRRTLAGLKRKAQEGLHLGPVPYGYRREGEKGAAKLRISEVPVVVHGGAAVSEAEIIRRIYRMIVGGQSTYSVARALNAIGIMPNMRAEDGSSRGLHHANRSSWTPGTVYRFARNPIYRGEHAVKFKDDAKPIAVEVPAIVDAATWNQAQARLGAQRREKGHKNATRTFLLRGKIRCPKCGRFYGGKATTARGVTRHYYAIGIRPETAKPGCAHKQIPCGTLEDAVWTEVRGFLNNPGEVLALISEQLGASVEARAALQEEIAEYRARLKAKDEEADRVVTAYAQGVIDLEALARQNGRLKEEREALGRYVADLEARVCSETEAANRGRGVEAALVGLREALARPITPQTQQDVIGALVEGIHVETILGPARGRGKHPEKRQTFRIVYRFEAPAREAEPLEPVDASRR